MKATIGTDLFRNWLYSGFAALKVFLPDRVQTARTSSRSLGADVLVWRVAFSYDFIRRYNYCRSGNNSAAVLGAGAHRLVAVRPQMIVGAWSAVKTARDDVTASVRPPVVTTGAVT